MTNQQVISEKPNTVVRAIQLYWAYLALEIINAALSWNQTITNVKSIPNFPMNPELFVFISWGLIFLILIWLLLKISSGRNWARITFLILTILGTPFSILSTIDVFNTSKAMFLIDLFLLILNLSICVLLFVPSSNAWFKKRKA